MAQGTLTYGYAPILKHDDLPDGSIMVYGQVSGTGLDRDQQRMDADFLKRALPAWMAEGGNIREQHNSQIAAGVAVELDQADGDRWMLKSHIVDSGTVAKVKAGVLKGYSVAITKGRLLLKGDGVPPKGLIVGGDIYETSLVDRPSLPEASVSIVKSAGNGDLFLATEDDQDPGNEDDREMISTKSAPDIELTAGEYRAALATVDGLLSGRLAESWVKSAGNHVGDVEDAVGDCASIAMYELNELVNEADLTKGFDIAPLLRAVSALETLIEPGQADAYTGAEPAIIRAASGENGATLLKSAFASFVEHRYPAALVGEDGEIVKVAGMVPSADVIEKAVKEATAPLESQLAVANAELAKFAGMTVPGGPVIVPKPTNSPGNITKSADQLKAAQYLREADRSTDPDVSRTMREAAEALLSGGAA